MGIYINVNTLTNKYIKMGSLDQWVNDQLHDVLGLSDKHVGQFLISLCGKSQGATDFVQRLQKTGAVEMTSGMISFATQLYDKVPHKRKAPVMTQSRIAEK